MGHFDVHHGFGIFESVLLTIGDGTLAGLLADGYGIRGTVFNGGSSVGSIVATGAGQNISTQLYSSDVRFSESVNFDPYFGFQPNLLTDINLYTGATAAVPQVPGHNGGGTDAGVIEDSVFVGNRDLGKVRAYQIRATDPVNAPDFFNFANSIGTFTTLSSVDGIVVTTGRVKSFHLGSDASHLITQISGPIRNLAFNGNVLGNSIISASGINGNIGSLKVAGDLVGSITAKRKIGKVTIGGNLTGTLNAQSISSITLGGFLNGGNLDIQGNVGTFQTAGHLGLPAEVLTFHGSVKTIKIGGNLDANINVQGNLGTLKVGQSIVGGNTVNVTGNLNLLDVTGDVQAGASVIAAVIKKQKIKGLVQGTIS